MAKPAGRPSRLLNLQKSPASKKAMRVALLTGCVILSLTKHVYNAATNTTSSPFLKLPAELRQRIYNYALGGYIIHVAPGETPGVAVCTNCDDFDDRTSHQNVRRAARNHFPWNFMILATHTKCYLQSCAQSGFSLHLLRTCRQIYHEGKKSCK